MHENAILPNHQSSNHLLAAPAPAIARSLEEGLDYPPDWRSQTVEKYLTEVAQSEDKAGKVAELAQAEADEFVRQLLRFHCGLVIEHKPAVEYAIGCLRRPEHAWGLKAMVVAGRSVQQIAEEMGTVPVNIECFEQLYFDARHYLGCRLWLEGICRGERGHRWLEVALDRGWPGVEEIVLRRFPKGPRDLHYAISVAVGRVQDYCLGQEADNVAPNEKDLALLRGMSQTSGELPFLEDPTEEKQPLPESTEFNSFKKLSFGEREKVRSFLDMLLDGAARKVVETEHDNAAATEETAEPVQPEQK
jgi:hypothetical protein